MIRKEIIKQYVASLKEDGELDYIFPLLLERMGYRVLSTPKQSKGQSQYGRDVVAVKKSKGEKTLYHFELKGFAARNITDRTLSEKDGLIESLRASKNTKYRDASIKGLSKYKKQYIFVHNGYVEANALITLNDFVEDEFPEGNFDRWDLEKLTTLFSEFLFDETLLTDDESYRLFKKVLVLLDAEGNDFYDIVALINILIANMEKKKSNQRNILNFFATLRLIASMVYIYAKDANNLTPAKFCIDTVLLKTWAWILRGNREKKTSIVRHFNSLVLLQVQIYEEYVNKILRFAKMDKGLYSFEASDTEYVFYPLRCYEFLGDLIYFYILTEAYCKLQKMEARNRMDLLEAIINNNPACAVPLLDTHSIPILMVYKYMVLHSSNNDDYQCLNNYLTDIAINLAKRHFKQKMWPEMRGDRMALARSLYEKDDNYNSESSLLLMSVFELIAYSNIPVLYSVFKKVVEESGVNLQIAFPIHEEVDIEQLLFEHRLNKELAVQTNIKLPDTIEDFQKTFKKKYSSIEYRTDAVNYGFLRVLAHKYYETDMFPDYLGRAYCID